MYHYHRLLKRQSYERSFHKKWHLLQSFTETFTTIVHKLELRVQIESAGFQSLFTSIQDVTRTSTQRISPTLLCVQRISLRWNHSRLGVCLYSIFSLAFDLLLDLVTISLRLLLLLYFTHYFVLLLNPYSSLIENVFKKMKILSSTIKSIL